MERTGLIKFKGRDMTVVGPDLTPGDPAPDFTVHTLGWLPFKALTETAGKVRIIAAVPSLDTDVCDRETRRFNQEAAALGAQVSILVVSTDLPYAQNRWCGASGVDQVIVLSDHMTAEFGAGYGCLMKEVRVLRRAVFVVGKTGRITYAAYMPALGEEPDYAAVLEAARAAL
jgi:thiol peroxidase